jgi:hypothetical protein
MSTRTTSHNCFSASLCAAVAPTLPAPITVTFVFIVSSYDLKIKKILKIMVSLYIKWRGLARFAIVLSSKIY